MIDAVIALSIGIGFAIGGWFLGRMLDDHGMEGLARGARVLGILLLVAGLGRAAWIGTRGAEGPSLEMPSFGSIFGEPATPEELRTACTTSDGFEDPATNSAYCECAVGAVEAARPTDPELTLETSQGGLVVRGTAFDAFADAFGACAAPQLGTWVTTTCVADCVSDGGERSACDTICSCVASGLTRGRTPPEIGRLFWVEAVGPNDSPDRGYENAMIRAVHECQLRYAR